MSINIGLSVVNKNANVVDIDFREEYDSLLEEETKDYSLALENLISIKAALEQVNYSPDAIFVLSQDPIFKQMIEAYADPKVAIEKTIQIGYEGIVTDFFRSGKPIGVYRSFFINNMAKHIYREYTRVSKYNETGLRFSKYAKWDVNALRLPAYDKTIALLSGAMELQKGCLLFSKNPKAGIGPVIKGLQRVGMKISEDAVVKSDYSMGKGTMLAVLASAIISPFATLIVGYAINKRPQDKGFTPKTAKDVAKKYLTLVEAMPTLQAMKPITEDKSIPDIGKKIKFVSSASKVYGKLMHGLGMGIYSVIGAVKEK